MEGCLGAPITNCCCYAKKDSSSKDLFKCIKWEYPAKNDLENVQIKRKDQQEDTEIRQRQFISTSMLGNNSYLRKITTRFGVQKVIYRHDGRVPFTTTDPDYMNQEPYYIERIGLSIAVSLNAESTLA